MYKNLLFLVIVITFSYFIINHISDMEVKEKKKKKKKVNNFSKPISTELSTNIDEYIDETINKYDKPLVTDHNPMDEVKEMINEEEQKKYINNVNNVLDEQKKSSYGVPTSFKPDYSKQKFVKQEMDNRVLQKKNIFVSSKNININAANQDSNNAYIN